MDEIVQKALQQAAALRKLPESVPWKFDEAWPQPYHVWNEGKWLPWKPSGSGLVSSEITTLALYTWNIDLMLPFAKERMDAALAHLKALTEQQLELHSKTAVVIKLQECIPDDLITIGKKQWIQDKFYLTDIDDAGWASAAYGTTMLIDRRLKISSCFRVHYSMTRMERDALFVDVAIPTRPDETLRLCNTHLESLALEPQYRPFQMQLVAKYMHADGISCAVVAGDFNAIQPSDRSLHSENNLKDAYYELGGKQNDENGCTWGQQALPALRQQFGLSRMDKVFFCGEGLRLQSLSRIGEDITVDEAEEEATRQLLLLGFEKAWVTDHLGLHATFTFIGDHRL